ncbi:MAG: ribonuclease HI [Rickettsiales bacterium]|jgi:ribonuclease HI|nr:ribonuclease HI [Rickettsiales bacterium]OUW71610.1 MAG: ribonuclease HI [Rickettsiales bacterium TMED211]
MSSNKLEIYTDGACLGNPGPGGWAALIIDNNQERILSGNNEMTTNNRMELLAVIKALESINHHLEITIYTDSKYVINGITSWIKKWKTNDWKNSSKTPVKNIDLWKILDVSSQKKKIKWVWVKGHSGNTYNDKVDEIARNQAETL